MQHYNFVHYSERMIIYRLILQSYKDQLRMNLYEEGGFTVYFIKIMLLIRIKKEKNNSAAKNRIADIDAIEAGGVNSDREYKVLWKWIHQKFTKKC